MNVPGKLIKVNDTKIHVFSIPSLQTQNPNTIVFLAGSGTECPTYDFKPLWHLLQGKYNMVVVERPGYGWSGLTKQPRDIDTILEETRKALNRTGITAPFIPAAHSLSGLEAIYWAQKYPNEISAIIGLDMAVPAVYSKLELPKLFNLQVRVGHLLRGPIAKAMVKQHPAVKNNLLDKDEQTAMREITSRQLLSKNVIDEIHYVQKNASKVSTGKCPSIPVLCYLANDKANLKRIPSWGKVHKEYFAGNSQATFINLNCGHYMHREDPQKIADSICKLLN